MNGQTSSIIITVTMVTYLLLLTTCYGHFDIEKRFHGLEDNYTLRRRTHFDRSFLRLLYRNLNRVRRNHQHMTDAGYGSRVQAGSKLANALIAHHVYGAFGPGRRKRSSGIQHRYSVSQIPF